MHSLGVLPYGALPGSLPQGASLLLERLSDSQVAATAQVSKWRECEVPTGSEMSAYRVKPEMIGAPSE